MLFMTFCTKLMQNISYSLRLIELERYLSWGSETGSPMLGIRQRNTMILPWSTCPTCSSCLLHVLLFTHLRMRDIRAGTLGSFLHSQAVSTCLVSPWIPFIVFCCCCCCCSRVHISPVGPSIRLSICSFTSLFSL